MWRFQATRRRRKATQCTKMTDLLANLCVCDFEDNTPSVSELYATGYPWTWYCFDRFGHGHNNATHVATWFRTFFPLSLRLTEGHRNSHTFHRSASWRYPWPCRYTPSLTTRRTRPRLPNNHVRSPPSTYVWEAHDPPQPEFTTARPSRYVLP